MLELADILRQTAPADLQALGEHLNARQRRALDDLRRCRTPALGGSLYVCDTCGTLAYAYHSCRNRHCPTCQEDRAQRWLERLRARLLPCDHYLLTFTLPAALRPLALAHPTLVYATLLREAAASLQALADEPAWVGGRLGILAVLHTWSRTLTFHPHAHLLVTAGGLAPDGTAWRKPRYARFLVPGYLLSTLFRTRVHTALARLGLTQGVDPAVWARPWVVHVQHVGAGHFAARYLARYVYKVALRNERLERFHDGQVTFRYTPSGTRDTRRMTLPLQEFLRRFLLHVLPHGFAKIRYFGLLSPTARADLERARTLLERARPAPAPKPATEPPASPAPRPCPHCCSGYLQLQATWTRSRAPP